nr:MAG TPA: hypothetical protein [Caudoviricetes sp.]
MKPWRVTSATTSVNTERRRPTRKHLSFISAVRAK